MLMVTPTRKLITVLMGLFLGEAAIMALINAIQLPAFAEAIADASVLILIALPILYIQFARPMVEQYQAIEKANHIAAILLGTSAQFAASMELAQLVNTLFQQIHALVPYDYAAVYTLQSQDWLSRRAVWKAGQILAENLEGETGLNLHDFPPFLQVIEAQKSISLGDIPFAADAFHHPSEGHLCSWLGIPLVAGGEVIGVFEIGRLDPAPLSRDEIRLAEGIASQAAVAIHNAEQYEEVRESRAQLKTLAQKVVEVQERERRRIAIELHENIVQTIAATLMKIRYLEDKIDQKEMAHSELNHIEQILTSLFQDLRNMAMNLRPLVLETGGLQAAIRQELTKLRDEHRLKIDFIESSPPAHLPKETEIMLYRIVQEALANVLQHAQATQVRVVFSQAGNDLMLSIEDDGIGFALRKLDQTTCLGIIGMRERAEMVGGTFLIESSIGKGTVIHVNVPILEKG